MSVRSIIRQHVLNNNPRAGHYMRHYRVCPDCGWIVGCHYKSGKLAHHTRSDLVSNVECSGSYTPWRDVKPATRKDWVALIEKRRRQLKLPKTRGTKMTQAALLDLLIWKG